MLLLSHQTAVEQHRLLLQGTGTDSDPVPKLSWASPMLGWQRQRPRRTCVKLPLQLHLPLPREEFVLSAQGTQVAYSGLPTPRQSRAQAKGMHRRPQGRSTSPRALTKNLPPHPMLQVQLFPELKEKKQIKATEQHSKAVGGSCSPQRTTGFWGTAGFRKPASLPGTQLQATAEALVRAPCARLFAGHEIKNHPRKRQRPC